MLKIGSVNTVANQYSKIQNAYARAEAPVKHERDEVQLSVDAKLFSEAFAGARRSAASLQAASEARAAELSASVGDGSYFVDAGAICDRLLFLA